jgi:hypothetical protein
MQSSYLAQLLDFSPDTCSADRTYKEHRLRVTENKVLRRMLGLKRQKITGSWKKKVQNVELHNLDSSPNIVWVITLWKMRRKEHVARMG